MSENDLITPATTDAEKAPGTNVVPMNTAPPEEPRKPIASFVKAHPILTIAGGLAVGAVAAALIPARNRRFVKRKAFDWADVVSTASIALAQQIADKAGDAGAAARHEADVLAGRAGKLGHAAMGRVERLADSAAGTAERLNPFHKPAPPTLAEKLVDKAVELKERLRA